MSKVKQVNYPPVMLSAMVASYLAAGRDLTPAGHNARAVVVDELVLEHGKEKRSICSKLSRELREIDGKMEKVYIAKSKPSSVTGGDAKKKDILALELITAAGDTSTISKAPLSSTALEKTNKIELSILTAQFDFLHAEIADQNAIIAAYQTEFGELPETDVKLENQGEIADQNAIIAAYQTGFVELP